MIKKRARTAIRAAQTSIAGNIVLATIKILTGWLGNSFAMIADGIESLADVFASTITWIGLRYANKPPDHNHPYGHGRAEPLITFLSVGFLIGSAIFIVIQAISNIQSPQKMPKPFVLIVLAVIITTKEVFYRIFRKKSEETSSSLLAAEAWHHRSDALTSLAAFIGVGIAVVFGPRYASADSWAALVAAGIIVYNSYLIFRPALGEIMDENIYHDLIGRIREASTEVPGILGTEKCLIRKMGMQYHVDLHAIVSSEITVKKGHERAHELKDHLMEKIPEIAEVHIHIEPDEY